MAGDFGLRGTLVTWKDDRGFGFIRPDGADDDVFVHIKAFQDSSHRPRVSQQLSFRIEKDGRGRKRAVAVEVLSGTAQSARASTAKDSKNHRRRGNKNHRSRGRNKTGTLGTRLPWAGVGFVLALFAAAGTGVVAQWIPTWMVGLSLVTFLVYWGDKSAAQAGRWRVPEINLHGLSLAGGWPGALLAQYRLRHKTSKTGFQVMFWLSVAGNLIVLFLLVDGQVTWSSIQGAF